MELSRSSAIAKKGTRHSCAFFASSVGVRSTARMPTNPERLKKREGSSSAIAQRSLTGVNWPALADEPLATEAAAKALIPSCFSWPLFCECRTIWRGDIAVLTAQPICAARHVHASENGDRGATHQRPRSSFQCARDTSTASKQEDSHDQGKAHDVGCYDDIAESAS